MLWSLMPSIVPSNESTWSLLFLMFVPVSMSVGWRVSRSKRWSRPRPRHGAAGVVDQRAAVGRPVGRLERLLGAVDDLLPAALHVEDLEHAADVLGIRLEPVLHRPDEPDIFEDRPLRDVAVVRAEREPDEHVIAEVDVGDLRGGKGIAELRGRKDVGLPLALDLDDVGALDRRTRPAR